MAVTDTDLCSEIIADAFRESQKVAANESPTSAENAIALRILNRMMKAWQNKGWHLWTVTSMSESATTSASYTLDPVRPFKIVSVRFKQGGRETPMIEMTRDEYDNLPVKTTTGTPTQWYYDRQREAAKLYVWPVPASVTTETLEITYHREIEDMGASDVIDAPAEWYEAIVYNLALRLANYFKVQQQPVNLAALAQMALADALADDREASITFGGYED